MLLFYAENSISFNRSEGSGKSFIGTLFETRFNIKFIRVEDWAKSVKRERAVDDQSYIEEVFRVIENGIRLELRTRDTLVFESTGLSSAFDDMLENLRSDFQVVTIRVNADEALCLSRVKTRDQNIHINVSDDQVRTINALVAERALSTDFRRYEQFRRPFSVGKGYFCYRRSSLLKATMAFYYLVFFSPTEVLTGG